MAIFSNLLKKVPGISHGFGTLDEPLPKFIAKNWDRDRPKWEQVHGAAFAQVNYKGQNCGQADALCTNEVDIPIGIVTADCVPILMAHRLGYSIAAVHAGWRGTRARILRNLWRHLALEGHDPREWVGAIGPAIGPCCYEVNEDLAADFSTELKDLANGVDIVQGRNLDLPGINAAELKEIGLSGVDLIRACTFCSVSPSFHSYRRELGPLRQFSIIIRDTSAALGLYY